MIKENLKTAGIFESDLVKVDSLVKQKCLKNRAEALRICIEYARAHGVFV